MENGAESSEHICLYIIHVEKSFQTLLKKKKLSHFNSFQSQIYLPKNVFQKVLLFIYCLMEKLEQNWNLALALDVMLRSIMLLKHPVSTGVGTVNLQTGGRGGGLWMSGLNGISLSLDLQPAFQGTQNTLIQTISRSNHIGTVVVSDM